jgi:hypothetical protein
MSWPFLIVQAELQVKKSGLLSHMASAGHMPGAAVRANALSTIHPRPVRGQESNLKEEL